MFTNDFIVQAIKTHGNKYDYSKSEYINSHTKICVICPIHGEFWQIPYTHLNGCGCPKCYGNKRLTTEEFIERSNIIHNNKYDYSKVEYKNKRTKVKIICPFHGEFEQEAGHHLKGQGCPMCGKQFAKTWRKGNFDKFVNESNKRFNNNYEFPNIEHEYENSHSKITIIHKECKTQFVKIACDHLTSHYGGCPCCYNSIMEEDIRNFLYKNNIIFEEEKTFKWLKYKRNLRVDFYLPTYNVVIECQGLQHFKEVSFNGKTNSLKENKLRDKAKYDLCSKHGIRIFYYANYKYNFPYKIYNDKEDLLDDILKIMYEKTDTDRVY